MTTPDTTTELYYDPTTGKHTHVAAAAESGRRTMNQSQAPEHMTMWWTETDWFPFVEDENGRITGPGHQEREAFARLVTAFDRTNDDKAPATSAEDIRHDWFLVHYDVEPAEWAGTLVREGTEGAIPVTSVWGR